MLRNIAKGVQESRAELALSTVIKRIVIKTGKPATSLKQRHTANPVGSNGQMPIGPEGIDKEMR